MRLIKKIFYAILILIGTLIIGLGIISHFYGEEIKGLVVNGLNKNLKTKIEIDNVEFSIWSHFPYASVVFSDVIVFATESESDTLLTAKNLSVEFSLIDLYHENYRLIGLSANEGSCALKVDPKGVPNYIFWDQQDETSSHFSTQLENVAFRNFSFSYEDLSEEINIDFFIDETNLNGNLSESIFNLTINTKLSNTNVQLGESNILTNRTLFIYTEGKVDQNNKSLSFQDANLGVDGMNLSLKGEYIYAPENRIDFSLKSNNASLERAIALLPKSLRKDLERFKIEGNTSFEGTIAGEISASRGPDYQFEFSIEDGTFQDKKSLLLFENSHLSGRVKGNTNNLSQSDLNIPGFETQLNKGLLSGKLSVKNFKNPNYAFEGDLNFDLASAQKFFQWDSIANAKGEVKAHLKMEGELSSIEEFSLNDWKRSNIEGNVVLNDLGLYDEINKLSFAQVKGYLDFTNNKISSENLKGNVNDNILTIDGESSNLIGYLIEDDEMLFVDANISSQKLDLNKLLSISTTSTEGGNEKNEFNLSPLLLLYLDLDFDSVSYNAIQCSEFQGQLILSKQQLDIRNSAFIMAGGNVMADFFVKERQKDLQFSARTQLDRVDIKQLFEQFDNFSQNTLQAEHIAGNMIANINFYSEWSKTFEANLKSIKAESSIIINDGILSNFKPLESLSKYIELDELREVKFKQLRNQILIKEETVYIPRFNVFSSAINLSMEGSHTFNNEVDYQFTLRLKDILGRKVKKPKESEFGYVEDEEFGGVKLFLKMTGTMDNPTVKYDAKQLRKNITKSFSKEKETTKSILKEEFGLFKNDSTIKPLPQKKRKRNPFQVEYDSSFNRENSKKQEEQEEEKENHEESKSKFGKFLDKIAKPNEEEYVNPEED